jgi:non-ribosomal peptide synthase protein (TIGR01720 family)
VAFNYLGQLDAVVGADRMFRGARESSGQSQNAKARRSHALIINSSVQGGELVMSWSYSSVIHARETIERVAQQQIERLRRVIEHCCEDDAGGFTPSDFPAAKLSQEDLDSFLASIS